MSKLGSFKNSLLMRAVALSCLSSPAIAVSDNEVKAYLLENSFEQFSLFSEDLNNLVLNNLMKLNDAQWGQFKITAQFLLTNVINGYDRSRVIAALGNTAPEIFSHEKFLATVQSFITPDMKGGNCADVIAALAKVAPEKWDAFVLKVNDLSKDMNGDNRARVIAALGEVDPEKWHTFVTIAETLSKDMHGGNRARVIAALANVVPEKLFHEKFVTIAKSLTEGMIAWERPIVIEALGYVPAE